MCMLDGDMHESKCYTTMVSIDGGDEVEVCLNHPYENRELDKMVRAGKTPDVTSMDVKRALDHFYKTRQTYDFENGMNGHKVRRGGALSRVKIEMVNDDI